MDLVNQDTLKIHANRTSVQDGGIGRHALPPHTTIRRITPNLKTKNNQNCQKTEVHGSPTTKDLKMKHSSKWTGGQGQTAMPERMDLGMVRWQRQWQWRPVDRAVPHSHAADKNWEGQPGSEWSQPQARLQPRVQALGNKSLITSGCKNQWLLGQWKKLLVT